MQAAKLQLSWCLIVPNGSWVCQAAFGRTRCTKQYAGELSLLLVGCAEEEEAAVSTAERARRLKEARRLLRDEPRSKRQTAMFEDEVRRSLACAAFAAWSACGCSSHLAAQHIFSVTSAVV